jgi:aldehyde dehydrogenase (NAD+)
MKDKFVNYLKEEITAAYGDYPAESPDFARIVNTKNWNRLVRMIDHEKVIIEDSQMRKVAIRSNIN